MNIVFQEFSLETFLINCFAGAEGQTTLLISLHKKRWWEEGDGSGGLAQDIKTQSGMMKKVYRSISERGLDFLKRRVCQKTLGESRRAKVVYVSSWSKNYVSYDGGIYTLSSWRG